ncbi:MAG: M23 family peptidase [Deltaproteobacteria bacterium]|nr:MAG: M23 family peptidase [Deltaproteobacteria bacterium]
MKKAIAVVVAVAVSLMVGLVLFAPPFERTPPQLKVPPEGSYIGAKAVFVIEAEDRPTGLKEASVALIQEGRTWSLYSQSFPPGTYRLRIPLSFEPKGLGIREGAATLEVRVRDRSLWRFGRGNVAVARVKLLVDYTPPRVELMANTRYIYFNGAGAVLFRTSLDASRAGVQVGNLFFKAFFKKEGQTLLGAALFGIPQYAKACEAHLVVEDRAGNQRVLPLSFDILPRRVPKDRVSLSEAFIREKIYPLLPPEKADLPPEEAFKAVNEEMRQRDEATISQMASHSSPEPMWHGAFLQMPNSKVTATFGDRRTYLYKGKVIGHSIHLGYDLASVAHAPVPAANKGRVLYTGFIGIYGNVVMVDHGLGLVSFYAHLSRYRVGEGDVVEKGDIIGYTDSTGLAGGDHLHFGVLLSGHPVDPVEWWDEKWLRERVMAVLQPFLGNGGRKGEER